MGVILPVHITRIIVSCMVLLETLVLLWFSITPFRQLLAYTELNISKILTLRYY